MSLSHEVDRASILDTADRHAVGVSWILRAVTGAFVVLAAASVFAGVSGRLGMLYGIAAAVAVVLGLGATAIKNERRQPVAFAIGQDGLTTWNRNGTAQYQRIIGCAQWSNSVLALTLLSAANRRSPFLLTADALSASAFRELAVRGRRCSQEHL